MKCAHEIIKANEEVKIQREINAINAASQKHQKACINAINFCENIVGPTFEREANAGVCAPCVSYIIESTTDRFGNIHFDVQESTSYTHTVHHRKGGTSKKTMYRWVTTHANIDKATFIAYLKAHCFTCEFHSCSIIINPTPNCE